MAVSSYYPNIFKGSGIASYFTAFQISSFPLMIWIFFNFPGELIYAGSHILSLALFAATWIWDVVSFLLTKKGESKGDSRILLSAFKAETG